jgi:hypothetical protein
MQVHCLIRRVGPTTVTLESTKYLFMPIPGTKYHKEMKYDHVKQPDGTMKKVPKEVSVPEESTSVCEISKQEHAEHLLKLSFYEEYDPQKVEAERMAAEKPVTMTGYAIEKYFESGYVAVDKRKKPYLYHGETGEWVPKGEKINPFKSELEAYLFLKDEVEFNKGGEEGENEESGLTEDLEKITSPKGKKKQ